MRQIARLTPQCTGRAQKRRAPVTVNVRARERCRVMFQGLACPICNSPLEARAEHNAVAQAIVTMVLSDLAGWCFAGLFVVVGLVWWPGYVVGAGVVLWLIVRQATRRTR